MPSANKTPNYNLTQYSNNGSDKISALKDYNEDMSKIDIALNDNANNIINKADKATTYTKSDIDDKVSTIDENIGTKADKSTTYTKTEVDGKTNAKADKAIVDSLGATDVESSKTLLRVIKNSDIFSILGEPTAVFLGDSFTQGVGASAQSNRYSSVLCKMLNLQEKNYAIGGTSWDSIVNTQIPNASADIQDKNSVRYVFMLTGINSYNSQVDNQKQYAINAMKNVKDAFPNAQIYTGGLAASLGYNKTPLTSHFGFFESMMYAQMGAGIPAIYVKGWNWLSGARIYSDSNDPVGLHPNDAGHAIIAANLASIARTGTPVLEGPLASSMGVIDTSFPTKEGLTFDINKVEIYPLKRGVLYTGEISAIPSVSYINGIALPAELQSLISIDDNPGTLLEAPSVLETGSVNTGDAYLEYNNLGVNLHIPTTSTSRMHFYFSHFTPYVYG